MCQTGVILLVANFVSTTVDDIIVKRLDFLTLLYFECTSANFNWKLIYFSNQKSEYCRVVYLANYCDCEKRSTKITYHPSGRVSVNPNCGSVATEIRIPVRPFPSGVTIFPLITDTRLKGFGEWNFGIYRMIHFDIDVWIVDDSMVMRRMVRRSNWEFSKWGKRWWFPVFMCTGPVQSIFLIFDFVCFFKFKFLKRKENKKNA